MSIKRFENRLDKSNIKFNTQNPVWDNEKKDALNVFEMIDLLNELYDVNKKLENDLTDCKKLKGKRLNKIRNHRAVIEDLGGAIRTYKGQISQLNEKIDKIKGVIDDDGVLTKRELNDILR